MVIKEIKNNKDLYFNYQLIDNKIIKNRIDNQLNQLNNHLIIYINQVSNIKNVEEQINNEVEKAINYYLKKYGPDYGHVFTILIYIYAKDIIEINAKKLNSLHNYMLIGIPEGEFNYSIFKGQNIRNMELRGELNNQLFITGETAGLLTNDSVFVPVHGAFVENKIVVNIFLSIDEVIEEKIPVLKKVIETGRYNEELWDILNK